MVKLSLAIQYGTAAPQLPRWRVRRWVQRSLDAAAHTLPGLQHAYFTLRFVDLEEGRALNLQFREKDYATNVLTFEYGLDPEGGLGGDIVLCVPVLEREADEQGKPLLSHAAHLTVHGVLHALGHDHLDADEARDMEALEVTVLAALGISDPYA